MYAFVNIIESYRDDHSEHHMFYYGKYTSYQCVLITTVTNFYSVVFNFGIIPDPFCQAILNKVSRNPIKNVILKHFIQRII